MKPRPFSFSMVLPLAQLTIWSLLIPTQVGYYFVLSSIGAKTGTMNFGHPSFHLFIFILNAVANKYSHFITTIDLRGAVGEVAVSLPTTWPSTWFPDGLTHWSWQAISFPFFALPFWGFAGRGLDGTIGSRRLHWATLLIGTLFSLFLVTMFFAFLFLVPKSDRDPDTNWVFWGVALWAIAFGPFPFSGIKSGLQRRKQRQLLKLETQIPPA